MSIDNKKILFLSSLFSFFCTFVAKRSKSLPMKLIVMTRAAFFVEEDKILTTLFEAGLDHLHLYKPETEPIYSERLLTLLDEDFSLSAELLLDLGCLAEEELSASDADEDESSPHAARNATTLKTTKNFFIKNVIIIPD